MIRIAKISYEGREWNAEPFPPHYKKMSVGDEYLLAESPEEWEQMKTQYLPEPEEESPAEHPVLTAVKSMSAEEKQELLTYLNLNQ